MWDLKLKRALWRGVWISLVYPLHAKDSFIERNMRNSWCALYPSCAPSKMDTDSLRGTSHTPCVPIYPFYVWEGAGFSPHIDGTILCWHQLYWEVHEGCMIFTSCTPFINKVLFRGASQHHTPLVYPMFMLKDSFMSWAWCTMYMYLYLSITLPCSRQLHRQVH